MEQRSSVSKKERKKKQSKSSFEPLHSRQRLLPSPKPYPPERVPPLCRRRSSVPLPTFTRNRRRSGGRGDDGVGRRGDELAVLHPAHGDADAGRPRVSSDGRRSQPLQGRVHRPIQQSHQPRRTHDLPREGFPAHRQGPSPVPFCSVPFLRPGAV
jgi:hypothetical protein